MEEISKEDYEKILVVNKELKDEYDKLFLENIDLQNKIKTLEVDAETYKGANDFLRSQNARLKEILSCVGIAYETYKKEQL